MRLSFCKCGRGLCSGIFLKKGVFQSGWKWISVSWDSGSHGAAEDECGGCGRNVRHASHGRTHTERSNPAKSRDLVSSSRDMAFVGGSTYTACEWRVCVKGAFPRA
jgi:hypothetical protein